MVATELNQHGTQGTIILQPNRSFSWRDNVWFLVGISGLSLMIGLMFMLQGFWLILPFGVLELSLLGACLYQCARFTHLQEVITFTPEALTIERGYGKPDKRHEFHRIFAQIFVRKPLHRWYGSKVAIRSKGKEVEVGSFLSEDERKSLIKDLRSMVSHFEGLRPSQR
jgi:uncharacterized membrane protein